MKRLIVMALLIAPSLAYAADAGTTTQDTAQRTAWLRECVQEKAKVYAKGPDSASEIAAAVMTSCQDGLVLIQNTLRNETKPYVDAAMAEITKRAKDEALMIVVDTRSKK